MLPSPRPPNFYRFQFYDTLVLWRSRYAFLGGISSSRRFKIVFPNKLLLRRGARTVGLADIRRTFQSR